MKTLSRYLVLATVSLLVTISCNHDTSQLSSDVTEFHNSSEPDLLHQTESISTMARRHIIFYEMRIQKIEEGLIKYQKDNSNLLLSLRNKIWLLKLESSRKDLQERLDYWQHVYTQSLLKGGHVVAYLSTDTISTALLI